MSEKKYIPLEECKDRYVYRIRSRNLRVGVFCKATNGFVGIRLKFGRLFLFEEYHYDTGAPYGTVWPLEELFELPEEISNRENLGTIDRRTGRKIIFDDTLEKPWWKYEDSGEVDRDIQAGMLDNKELFEFLKKYEEDTLSGVVR